MCPGPSLEIRDDTRPSRSVKSTVREGVKIGRCFLATTLSRPRNAICQSCEATSTSNLNSRGAWRDT
eukprot:3395081-Pyramimonas_sp.AAC.2